MAQQAVCHVVTTNAPLQGAAVHNPFAAPKLFATTVRSRRDAIRQSVASALSRWSSSCDCDSQGRVLTPVENGWDIIEVQTDGHGSGVSAMRRRELRSLSDHDPVGSGCGHGDWWRRGSSHRQTECATTRCGKRVRSRGSRYCAARAKRSVSGAGLAAGSQGRIEAKIARVTTLGGLVTLRLEFQLVEGTRCRSPARPQSRRQEGKLQVNYGLITERRGVRVAVVATRATPGDCKTFLAASAQDARSVWLGACGVGRG